MIACLRMLPGARNQHLQWIEELRGSQNNFPHADQTGI